MTNVPPATEFGKKAKIFSLLLTKLHSNRQRLVSLLRTRGSQNNSFIPVSMVNQIQKITGSLFCALGKSSEKQHVYRVIYIHATLSFPAPHNSCSHPLIHSLSQPISVSVFLLKTVFCRLFPFNTCDIATTTIITGGEVAPPFPQGSGSLFFLAIFGPVCSVGFGRPLQLPILNVIAQAAISNR